MRFSIAYHDSIYFQGIQIESETGSGTGSMTGNEPVLCPKIAKVIDINSIFSPVS